LALSGGLTKPVTANLIESGKLILEGLKETEKSLGKLERREKA